MRIRKCPGCEYSILKYKSIHSTKQLFWEKCESKYICSYVLYMNICLYFSYSHKQYENRFITRVSEDFYLIVGWYFCIENTVTNTAKMLDVIHIETTQLDSETRYWYPTVSFVPRKGTPSFKAKSWTEPMQSTTNLIAVLCVNRIK